MLSNYIKCIESYILEIIQKHFTFTYTISVAVFKIVEKLQEIIKIEVFIRY